ncbi:hypothetical protein MWU58_01530 [Flavobacteriaceae bacterium S0825]|uniref:hypothetical protein n=1 Tax=Gaetbulibacter sp. S0825 TaxID=2720084 RepID=UPI001431B975|nr:hypothetical protein [Gaetbulibacter sp. S0825]MCK0107963.1 hypothetical protein [Flavobacteriaceae bacterium S0825]NIX63599.1 hypothetical protein [Gaetbulibacter sp. S0825]
MKRKTPFFVLALFLSVFLVFKSCVINNPQPEDCEVVEVTIKKITEGSSYDIVFHDTGTDYYYINRGLEQGLNLETLNAKVLNKTVTLHLPKLLLGTSEHIAQIAIGDDIIFTEFD